MSFVVPAFPFNCQGWRQEGVAGAYLSPDFVSKCNLSPGRRGNVAASDAFTHIVPVVPMELLLPVGTDIRAAWNIDAEDLVEVPLGSKRFYYVIQVDDIGKGFANEHRIAWIVYSPNGAVNFTPAIPAPVPLP